MCLNAFPVLTCLFLPRISVCPGTELVLDQMTEWSGNVPWMTGDATRGLWIPNKSILEEEDANGGGNKVGGWVKTYRGLTFLVVYNSGHLVPHNLPVQSLDLLQRFVSNQSYVDIEIPNYFDDNTVSADGSNSLSRLSNNSTTKANGKIAHASTVHGTRYHSYRDGGWYLFGCGILVGILGTILGFNLNDRRKNRGGYEPIPSSTRL